MNKSTKDSPKRFIKTYFHWVLKKGGKGKHCKQTEHQEEQNADKNKSCRKEIAQNH